MRNKKRTFLERCFKLGMGYKVNYIHYTVISPFILLIEIVNN